MLTAALGTLGRHATLVMAGGVFLGLLLPDAARLLRPLLAPAILFMLALTMVRTDWPALVHRVRRPGPALAAIAWLLLVSAPLMLLLASPFAPAPDIAVMLVLFASAPPIVSSAAITLLLRLEPPLALIAGTVATLLVPLTMPPVALLLLGLELDVALGEFMLRLGWLIGGAVVAAAVLRRWLGPRRLAERAEQIDGLIVAGMIVFAIAVMDGVTAQILADPAGVAAIVALAFAANLSFQALGAVAFLPLGRRAALTVGLMSGNRNMGLVLAALGASASPSFVLFVAAAQFPIYLLPALQRRFYPALLAGRD